MNKLFILPLFILCLTNCSFNKNTPNNEALELDSLQIINQQIDESPKDARLYLLRANIYISNNMFGQASQDYKTASQLSPSDNSIKIQYANFLCYKVRDINSSSMLYQQLESSSLEKPVVYTSYADCMASFGNEDDMATDLYLKALSYKSPPIGAYEGIISIYNKQGNYAIANYYAGLYDGIETEQSLNMQITALSNLLSSNQPIKNKAELTKKLDNLKSKFSSLYAKINKVESQNTVQTSSPEQNKRVIIVDSSKVVKDHQTVRNVQGASSNLSNSPDDFTTRILHEKSGRKYVILKPGETLYRIHVYSKIPVDKLESLNKIKNNVVKVGDKIYLD